MASKTFCILDYETYSEAPLEQVGGWEYSVHPSTEILCAALRIGTRETLPTAKTVLWVPSVAEHGFADLLRALRNPEIDLVAHNAIFEQMITRNVFARRYMLSKLSELQSIPIERWHCSAAMSRALGLPGSLEGAGAELNLTIQKDKEGKKLVDALCKPRKPTKKNPSTRDIDPAKIWRLAQYCVRDVDTTTELFLKLPPLHPKQRKFWVMNQKTNLRGFQVDRELALGALKLIGLETARLDKRVQQLTGGALNSARQNEGLLKWLQARGHCLTDLTAPNVRDYLEEQPAGKKDVGLELLRIRQNVSKSSTAKWAAFESRSRFDGRVRDTTTFYGAHTGRDAGSGLQPQNLFKSVLSQADVEAGLELIRRADFHAIHALYPSLMNLLASALRSCIIARDGYTLEVGDFATIEVRFLFWLCGELEALGALEKGEPVYSDMASGIHGVPGNTIEAGHKAGQKEFSLMRQLGKQIVLGGGFGIGVGGEKFQKTCKQYGMEISLELAQRAVKAYRTKYKKVPLFWKNLERAAILAVQNPKKAYRVGYLIWRMESTSLTVQLPSGRKLYYPSAKADMRSTLYGPKATLSYRTQIKPKLFGRVTTWGGSLAENCVQACAADGLYEALVRLEEAGRPPVLPVHDEIVSETKGNGDAKSFEKIMATGEPWAKGLPIKVEAWAEKRYRK